MKFCSIINLYSICLDECLRKLHTFLPGKNRFAKGIACFIFHEQLNFPVIMFFKCVFQVKGWRRDTLYSSWTSSASYEQPYRADYSGNAKEMPRSVKSMHRFPIICSTRRIFTFQRRPILHLCERFSIRTRIATTEKYQTVRMCVIHLSQNVLLLSQSESVKMFPIRSVKRTLHR